LALKVGAVATPLELAITKAEAPKVPLAPEPGAEKVTCALGITFPPESFTVACSAVAKAVLIVALCGVPAVAVTVAATPEVLFKLKLAGAPTPAAVAVTV